MILLVFIVWDGTAEYYQLQVDIWAGKTPYISNGSNSLIIYYEKTTLISILLK